MLEHPKSVRVLATVKSYLTELRRYIEDADQWLNKSNTQSKRVKRRVTEIFTFYAQICRAEPEDQENADGVTPAVDVLAPASIPAGEQAPEGEPVAPDGQPPVSAISQSSTVQSKVNQRDFILFEEVSYRQNKEN
jgi:hypothetical protein